VAESRGILKILSPSDSSFKKEQNISLFLKSVAEGQEILFLRMTKHYSFLIVNFYNHVSNTFRVS
jgi:hypothetical protein